MSYSLPQAENVGTGAVAAAQLHATADISSLITWQPGKPVPYAFLADTFESIASTTKRLEIIVTLTSAFRAILASSPEDLVPAVYLCGNRVAPPHDGMELGLGEALLLKVRRGGACRAGGSGGKAGRGAGKLGGATKGGRRVKDNEVQEDRGRVWGSRRGEGGGWGQGEGEGGG